MKTEQPLWGRGIMISPQHFQQQVAYAAWSAEAIARMGLSQPWGVIHAAFEQEMLKLGRLQARHLHIRFQDGTLIDTDNADALPPVLSLENVSHEVVVLLALPLLRANGGNCLKPDEVAERPVRYRQHWRDVRNTFGDDIRQIAVMQPELTLRFAHQNNSDYLTCPVVRLQQDSQGMWQPDETFLPPLLTLQGSRWLLTQLEQLMTQLRARLSRLMAMRRESNERMADFAVADVSLFWLLNALNSAEPVLGQFQRHPQSPPERLYPELARLAGSLLTFSLEHQVSAIPAFAADGAEETASAMKWVYVARPEYQANVEVLATLPAPVKKWKSFVAGMGAMLAISVAAVGSWQYVNRPNPLQAQLAASLAPLPATLTPEQVDLLRQQTALPQNVIARTQQQLNRLDKLPPGWSIDYSRQLVEQAQALWPEQAKSLAQQWQQQRSAAALPAEQLNGWSQGMMTLQKLSDRLNSLDEQKGKYITVSELKSVVFATMQFFNQSIPAEEQLRLLSQHPAGKPLPAAAQSQLEMHLKQLTARYAELKQQAEK